MPHTPHPFDNANANASSAQGIASLRDRLPSMDVGFGGARLRLGASSAERWGGEQAASRGQLACGR